MPKKKKKKVSSTEKLNRKLDKIIKTQDQILKNQKHIEELETKELKESRNIEREETETEEELKKLEELEKGIKKDVGPHPITKITARDFTKGVIGAFVGIVAHFAFLEGAHVAETFSMLRASLLYITSFIIGILFLYFSGFRKIKKIVMLKFIPLRIVVIYFTAIIVTIIVLALFGEITSASTFTHIYKTVSAISVLAILGAATADLIGKD